MYCAACSVGIEQTLQALPGVESADVNPATRRARVVWDPERVRASSMVAAIEAAGYRAYPALSLQAEAGRRREQRTMLWRLFVAGFCAMQVMMYAAPLYWAGPGDMSPDIARLLLWASWLLCIPVLVFSSGPFLRGAWQQIRHRRIGMDVPVALGIVVTFVASTGAAFDPGGPFGHEVYFDSLAMFVFFLLCGRWLEMRSRSATVGALESLMLRLPEMVRRLGPGDAVEMVPVRRIRPGDRVQVLPGEAFPADGRLCDGSTQVDEALLSGESTPVLRGPGQAVLAGSFNLGAPVSLEVERAGGDTRYAQIVALMEHASTERPQLVRQADRIAAPFLWAVLLAALLAAAVWSFIDPGHAVWVAVSVLIVTCPCALSLATPSALLAAAGQLARGGVLVQRLVALEALARADLFVFDKTGTLTEDRLGLAGVSPAPGWTRAAALRHAAALAAGSLHPVSRALCEAARSEQAGPELLTGLREIAGRGVEGRDAAGRCWRLGSAGFAGTEAAPTGGQGVAAWLSVDGALVASFAFDERLRADARDAIAALQADGARVMLLSGDRGESAGRVARSLGLSEVHAGASPEDKLRLLSEAQAGGAKVAMVGDGVNDGPVLARADVSIAMGQGAPLARAQADLTLLGGRLADLVRARRLARRMLRIVRQNLAWAALYNAACVPLALLGWLPPWLAGLGMASSSLLVVLNAQRLRRPEAAAPAAARTPPGALAPVVPVTRG
ncbi:MAG: cadmium-translocating P-type ATPase [Proteobacteria bacterium]|nr:cadmium-translocating P-type ATPase [Pseudomonadota bacterium]